MICMSKCFKIVLSVIVIFCLLVAIVPTSVYLFRDSISKEKLPQDFESQSEQTCFKNNADVRIMSSNLLVGYESWGGKPVKPRAKQYISLIEKYSPDVIGIQEMCDGWFCCIKHNLPKGYKMLYPVSTGSFVRMTAMVYNSETLSLIDSGNFAYSEKDNPRLRRVVWAVFETKADGKRFAVTNTHFSLLREGEEEKYMNIMNVQKDEIIACVNELYQKYECPVFSVGDFNTMEDTPNTKPIDYPDLYNNILSDLRDTKTLCKNKVVGTLQNWEYPSYDHIFLKGDAEVETFAVLSYEYLKDLSDHFPIFADFNLK